MIRRRTLWSVSKGVLRGSTTATETNIDLVCRGGARSWNPDADVNLVVKLWVQGTVVGTPGYGFGPAPTAVANASATAVDYDRDLACSVEAGTASGYAQAVILADCGDARTYERGEYFTSSAITPKPECNDFIDYVPSLSRYGFDGEWNSSPTYPWAILKNFAVANTYCVVANYGSTSPLESGYRNPAHNANQPG
jgi:hypothetical protein